MALGDGVKCQSMSLHSFTWVDISNFLGETIIPLCNVYSISEVPFYVLHAQRRLFMGLPPYRHLTHSLRPGRYLRSYMKVNGKVRYWAQLLYSWMKFPFNLNRVQKRIMMNAHIDPHSSFSESFS